MNYSRLTQYLLGIGICFVLTISCTPPSTTMTTQQPTFEIITRDNSNLLSPQDELISDEFVENTHSIYSYRQHTLPGTDTPSECDCDYREIILSLHTDHTFELEDQKGRLTILSLQVHRGTWKLKDKNTLVLSIDSIEVHEPHQTSVTRYPEGELKMYTLLENHLNYENGIQLTSSNPID